jgi:hypothetical protein
LVPLADVTPAIRRDRQPRPFARRHRSALVIAAIACAAVATAAGGTYSLITESGSQAATPSLVSQGGPLACAGLIGKDARQAQTFLEGHGWTISWRFTHYYNPAEHNGEAGYASTPATVPPGSLVEDIVSGGGKIAVVFVRGAHDPNAPPLSQQSPAGC